MFERKEVEKLAQLSRMKLTDGEIEELSKEIDSILSYVSEIKSVTVPEEKLSAGVHRNVFREDKNPHESGVFTETLLKSAPQREGNYIKVKKILSHGN